MTSNKKHGLLAKIALNIRNRMISGVFVIVPFMVTVIIIMWLFNILAKFIQPIVGKVLDLIPELTQVYIEYAVSFATILSLLFLIYLIGVVAKFVAGRRLLAMGETILMKIPLVRTIYSATKQVTTAITMQDSASFKSVVLVEFPGPGCYSFGFLTGSIIDSRGNKFCKVFVSTTPNPTTGFFILLPIEKVQKIEMSIEEAFKMIISAGIVSPEKVLYSNQPMNTQ
jgi:uncharacterized membrane protein